MLRTPFIETLSDLFIRSAGWRGRDEMFVDEENRITGAEALDQALRMAQGFADRGATPGAVIAYLCRSSARHAVAWFAAPLSGRVACSLHVRECRSVWARRSTGSRPKYWCMTGISKP